MLAFAPAQPGSLLWHACRQGAVKEVLALMPRPALHARSLAFEHPISGKRLSFEIPPPADFQAALEALRKLS